MRVISIMIRFTFLCSIAAVLTTSKAASHVLLTFVSSSNTLSKSSRGPFILTIHAGIEGSEPVTEDTFRTILHPRMDTLGYQGLTFEDVDTGELAPVMDYVYQPAEMFSVDSTALIELPSANSGKAPHTPSHTLLIERAC